MRSIPILRIAISCIACTTLLSACDPASLIDAEPPATIVDPSAVQTPEGAMQLYHQAVGTFSTSFGGVPPGDGSGGHVTLSGLLADEMIYGSGGPFGGIDERTAADLGSFYVGLYHRPRVVAQQAREALRRYHPNVPPSLLGRLHALEGYVLIFFAEVFCSGIPLTQVSLVGSPVLTRAYSTTETLERAIAQFDSAIVLSADSVRFINLAKVGRGRALLALGRFADAKQAVADVPLDFVYAAEFGEDSYQMNALATRPWIVQVADREGENGLVWSGDPRTAVTTAPGVTGPMPLTAKYTVTNGQLTPETAAPTTPIRLADGLEARLIEAEADLAGPTPGAWLSTLRMLRETCVGTAPCAPVPGLSVTNLPANDLVDPGTAATRLDLLMRERAMWLFATGHRQGDMRRLARIYERNPETIWPTGIYRNPGFPPLTFAHSSNGTSYGKQYVLDHGVDTNNPLYAGCLDLDP